MNTGLEIAVVGMACRFPGAGNVGEFWANLRDGVESITHFTAEELAEAGVPRALLDDPAYVRARGVLEDPALFDAGFFNINPREAELMDPQHRLFLECAWEALEDSGYAAGGDAGPVGVFAGAYENTYRQLVHANPETVESAGWLLTHLSGERDYLATRVSYKLDLRGPSLTVQTACSTSLVAVHLASQALLSGSCDLALAGGSTVRAGQREGYLFEQEGILSPDGHCRAFDAAAQGTVSSSGVGVVVLKRLEDAVRDRDTIHAVVKGSAVNNDGAAKVGFSAPSVIGQARAIRSAHVMAEIDPATVGYVETHGSGTALGDPIEVEGLTRAFLAGSARPSGCAIGSVKTNIGHTHAASGAAGLIKTVLALRHRQIPPSLHYERPNPDIDFEGSPFHVNTTLTDWPAGGSPRRAGVSSFGTGGTNAHVVLEEAPVRPAAAGARTWQLLVLSGHTAAAVEAAADRLADHLRAGSEQQFADVAFTLQAGRKTLSHRRAIVCRDAADAAEALAGRDPRRLLRQDPGPAQDRPVAFVFSGLGDQYPDMARDLYESEPVFRAELDRCAELFRHQLGVDLRTLLYPDSETGGEASGQAGMDLRALLGRGGAQPDAGSRELDRTRYAQPVMFMLEWALARLWTAWGIRPQAMIGYSIGEWVAACVAEVLSLEDAVFLVARRAMLIDALPGGAMLAVPLPEHEAAALDALLSVAAVNGPSMSVLAGPTAAIAGVQERLERQGVACRRLQTTHAFHSGMLDAARAELAELAGTVVLRPPTTPYISNLTGTWISDAEATDPDYWARHMCQTVRFSEGVQELWRTPGRILLEVGPGQAYSSLALQLLPEAEAEAEAEDQDEDQDRDESRMALSSLPPAYDRQPAARFLLNSLGRLWLAGVEPDWTGVHSGEDRGRVPLPTYPFQRARYWIGAEAPAGPGRRAAGAAGPGTDGMKKRPDIADWFSVPSWASTAPLAPVDPAELARNPERWLLFVDGLGVGDRVASRLLAAGHRVTVVAAGDRFEAQGPDRFVVVPNRREDYDELFRHLGDLPHRIVHLWTVTADGPGRPSPERLDRLQGLGFSSLLLLTQALAARGGDEALHVAVVSDGLRQVVDGEAITPEKATLVGPCTVLAQEHPALTSQSIDIVVPGPASSVDDGLVDRLLAELVRRPADPVVAHRGRGRWTPGWEPVRVEHPERRPGRLRERGVYLITGGLGGIGLALADHLARGVRARLVLVGRTALPGREEWDGRLAAAAAGDEIASRIREVLALEELGAEVLVVAADVADEERMRAAVRAARERFGTIHGVIHAAGVPGAGVMQLKRPADAQRVLAPKVLGTLVLDAVTRDLGLDFMLLCSSTIAVSGGLGQVDYCAANAFLDAFSRFRNAAGDGHTVSVNWDAWQEVGMAVKTVGQGGDPASRPRDLGHVLLHRLQADTETHAIYATEFASPRDWVVNEHRMLGHAVIPGTAYLEMVRAAMADLGPEGPVRFEDVLFIAPVVLKDGGSREVHVVIEKSAGAHSFSVVSQEPRAADGKPRWTEHVVGRVAPLTGAVAAQTWSPSELIDRYGLREVGGLRHRGPMEFGPRSQCLERVWAGDGAALALLAMPEPHTGDVAGLGLHPFLLDVATGFASLYLEADYLMPLRYQALDVVGRIPARVYSMLRYRDDDGGTTKETISFDIVLFDESGREVARAEEFVMKKARDLPAKLSALRDGQSDEVNVYAYPELRVAGTADNAFLEHLETGILPSEGVEAFDRVLAMGLSPQAVVATKDLSAIIAGVGALRPDAANPAARRPRTRRHARPNLPTAFAAPGNDVEQTIADLWAEHIGLDQVGIHDHFYELGGHSLLGLKLLADLREAFQVQITLQLFFENLTVAELAQVVSAQSEHVQSATRQS
ncbi:MAG: SDR family NAD(P)-dependent oxidoreductase [Catenulispora sp.]